jgi:nucleotide-binding universal stress UspA family protein
MSGTVVVGVDGSGTAKKAAERARDLATALGANLHVVSAYDSDRTDVFGAGSDQVVISEADNAENVARLVANSLQGETPVTFAAVRGRPAEALIKEADHVEAKLIVVGNRRMQGVGRVLGSIANSVAHNAPCDVYIANTYGTD